MKGAFGVAEDTSDASIACRQVGPLDLAMAGMRGADRHLLIDGLGALS
jgi:catabolite regulation protein CreA